MAIVVSVGLALGSTLCLANLMTDAASANVSTVKSRFKPRRNGNDSSRHAARNGKPKNGRRKNSGGN